MLDDEKKIEEKLLGLIADVLKRRSIIYNGSDNILKAGYDSLLVLSLSLEIENEFDFEIPDSLLTMNNFTSVKKIVNLIYRLA